MVASPVCSTKHDVVFCAAGVTREPRCSAECAGPYVVFCGAGVTREPRCSAESAESL
jgi:hypothetical protein